jgi:hypothetical protein
VKKFPILLVSTVLPLAFARGAGAVEGEHQLGVNIGVPMLTISEPTTGKTTIEAGPAFGIHYGYGITDQFNLLVEVQYAVLFGAATTPMSATGSTTPSNASTVDPGQLWSADAGLTYVLDVLRWVPYFGAMAGGYLFQGGALPASVLLPGAEIVVGLDYLVTPRWAVGFEFNEHFLFTVSNVYTSYTTGFLRTEFRWGK